MGELIIIRHGETEWSRAGRHTSHTDLPLTDLGERQARALVPLLAERRIGLTLVSPLLRARRTAELAGLAGPRVVPELREWDYGAYEGVTTEEIHANRPGWNLWHDGVEPGQDPAHPGEDPVEVGARADHVLDMVRASLGEVGDADIALVAHSHVLRVLTARYLHMTPAGGALFQLATGAVSRLGTEHGQPVITAWNVALPEGLLDRA